MRVYDCNWMQLERYLERDDRIVLPLGSTEQHAYLSLGTDSILAERVSVEAAEPLGVPVLPALPFGLTPYFAAFPGSPTLTEPTFLAVIGELLHSLHEQGFRRFLLVDGHGGNTPAGENAAWWESELEDTEVRYHAWWNGAKVVATARSIDPDFNHASWYENFPWTRLAGIELPREQKPQVDEAALEAAERSSPAEVRRLIGDGSFGGLYERPDEDVLRVWEAGVEEVREALERGWRA